MALLNLTGGTIVVRVPGRQDYPLPPARVPASMQEKMYPAEYVDGVPTVRLEVFNLNIPTDGINDTDLLVVDEDLFNAAQMQGHELKDRLVMPDYGASAVRTTDLTRQGQVVAVTQFIRPGTGEVDEADRNPQGQSQSTEYNGGRAESRSQADRDRQQNLASGPRKGT